MVTSANFQAYHSRNRREGGLSVDRGGVLLEGLMRIGIGLKGRTRADNFRGWKKKTGGRKDLQGHQAANVHGARMWW